MGKENVVYTCNGMLVSIKKEEILPFTTTQMNLEGHDAGGISLSQDKYGITSLICGLCTSQTHRNRD